MTTHKLGINILRQLWREKGMNTLRPNSWKPFSNGTMKNTQSPTFPTFWWKTASWEMSKTEGALDGASFYGIT